MDETERLIVVSRAVLEKCFNDGWNACAAAFDAKPNVPTFDKWFDENIFVEDYR